MEAKFLFAQIRAISKDAEDVRDNIKFKDALYLTRKTDVFAHSDMAKICGFHPSTGGFVKRLRLKGKEHYYGESVSCRVDTDDSMLELYRELTATGQWWKLVENYDRRTVTVFCVTEAGFKPSGVLTKVTWVEATYDEVYPTLQEEYNKAYGL